MRTPARILGTVVTLIAWLGHVSRAVRQSDDYSGWWILAVTVCAAIILLALWWPAREEHDREQR